MTRIRSLTAVLIIGAALASCSTLHKGKPKTPVVGDRISILSTELDVIVDPATAAIPMSLPPAQVNAARQCKKRQQQQDKGHILRQ